jgi:hypothetical protein
LSLKKKQSNCGRLRYKAKAKIYYSFAIDILKIIFLFLKSIFHSKYIYKGHWNNTVKKWMVRDNYLS